MIGHMTGQTPWSAQKDQSSICMYGVGVGVFIRIFVVFVIDPYFCCVCD